MSDDLDQQAVNQIRRIVQQQRYRVMWLLGEPRRGKTRFALDLAQQQGWRYLDYTLTPGYFDTLQTRIVAYQPFELIESIGQWCLQTSNSVLVLDELDALLACWTAMQRNVLANKLSHSAYLPCGLVVITHLFDADTLIPLVPNQDSRYCLTL
jgi:hypothetical protein